MANISGDDYVSPFTLSGFMGVKESGKVAFSRRWRRRDSVRIYVAVFYDEEFRNLMGHEGVTRVYNCMSGIEKEMQ